jgi:hypothetical protein
LASGVGSGIAAVIAGVVAAAIASFVAWFLGPEVGDAGFITGGPAAGCAVGAAAAVCYSTSLRDEGHVQRAASGGLSVTNFLQVCAGMIVLGVISYFTTQIKFFKLIIEGPQDQTKSLVYAFLSLLLSGLISLPLAASAWWRKQTGTRIYKPTAGLSFARSILLFTAIIGIVASVLLTPYINDNRHMAPIHRGAIGLLCGYILVDLFTPSQLFAERYMSKKGSAVAVFLIFLTGTVGVLAFLILSPTFQHLNSGQRWYIPAVVCAGLTAGFALFAGLPKVVSHNR